MVSFTSLPILMLTFMVVVMSTHGKMSSIMMNIKDGTMFTMVIPEFRNKLMQELNSD